MELSGFRWILRGFGHKSAIAKSGEICLFSKCNKSAIPKIFGSADLCHFPSADFGRTVELCHFAKKTFSEGELVSFSIADLLPGAEFSPTKCENLWNMSILAFVTLNQLLHLFIVNKIILSSNFIGRVNGRGEEVVNCILELNHTNLFIWSRKWNISRKSKKKKLHQLCREVNDC